MFAGLITSYIIVSAGVGAIDLCREAAQEEYLSCFPKGDIGHNVFPKKIYGIHNWIFIPSWVVIRTWYFIAK